MYLKYELKYVHNCLSNHRSLQYVSFLVLKVFLPFFPSNLNEETIIIIKHKDVKHFKKHFLCHMYKAALMLIKIYKERKFENKCSNWSILLCILSFICFFKKKIKELLKTTLQNYGLQI